MIRINGPLNQPIAIIIGLAIEHGFDLTATYADEMWSISGEKRSSKPTSTNPFDQVPDKPDTTIDTPVTVSPTPTPFG